MQRTQTQQVIFIGGFAAAGAVAGAVGEAADEAEIENENAFYKANFDDLSSVLELEAFDGSKTYSTISSINGHAVELDVNSTPVSNIQALDDWAAI